MSQVSLMLHLLLMSSEGSGSTVGIDQLICIGSEQGTHAAARQRVPLEVCKQFSAGLPGTFIADIYYLSNNRFSVLEHVSRNFYVRT